MIRERYLLAFVIWTAAYAQPLPTDLFLRGYKVIPTPQKVSLGEGSVTIDAQWAVQSADNIASRSLLGDLSGFHSLRLRQVNGATNGLFGKCRAVGCNKNALVHDMSSSFDETF